VNENESDDIVLALAGEVAIRKGHTNIATQEIAPQARARGVTDEMLSESLQFLAEEGYIDQYRGSDHYLGDGFRLAFRGLEWYATTHVPGYEGIVVDVADRIVGAGETDNRQITASLGQHGLVVTHILDRLHRTGFIGDVMHVSDGTAYVRDPRVRLKRLVRQAKSSR